MLICPRNVPKSDHRGVVGLQFHSSMKWCNKQPLTFDLTHIVSAPSIFHPLCPFPPPPSLSWSQAKVDNEIIDYRDLAAIPRVKAIYDIEHPDMISYKSVNDNPSTLDNKGNRQNRQSPAEVTSSNAPSCIQRHVCVSLFWCFVLVWFTNRTKRGLVLLCSYLTVFGPKCKGFYCEKWIDVFSSVF